MNLGLYRHGTQSQYLFVVRDQFSFLSSWSIARLLRCVFVGDILVYAGQEFMPRVAGGHWVGSMVAAR